MALTIDEDIKYPDELAGDLGILTGGVDFDSSYPSGGEDASPISGFFRKCYTIDLSSQSGYSFDYDRSNDKIIVYEDGDEVANETDLSSVTDVVFVAIGVTR